MASVIAALILLSPIVALLAVIAAEMLIDGLMEAGVTGVSAIAIGAVGWVQFRRIWRSEIAQLSGSKELSEAPLIAAPLGSGGLASVDCQATLHPIFFSVLVGWVRA